MGTYRKYSLDNTFFDKIDTEEKAYFLGFLFADGYNSISKGTIRLVLAKKDSEILYKLRAIIKTDIPIRFEERVVKGKTYYSAGLHFHSIGMCRKLESYGMTQNKSLTLEFPKILKRLEHHFIRGYFDGDGSIGQTGGRKQPQVSICGTKNFMEKIRSVFVLKIGLSKVKLYKPKNISYLTYCGTINCEKIYKYLYAGASIYLSRKYEKFYKLYGSENNKKILNVVGDKLRGRRSVLRIFSDEDVASIKKLKVNNTIKNIALFYGKSESAICNILYKKDIYQNMKYYD